MAMQGRVFWERWEERVKMLKDMSSMVDVRVEGKVMKEEYKVIVFVEVFIVDFLLIILLLLLLLLLF